MSSPWGWRTLVPTRNYVENIHELMQIFLFQRQNIWFYACWVKSARGDLIEPNREQKGTCLTAFLFWLQRGSKMPCSTHCFVSLGKSSCEQGSQIQLELRCELETKVRVGLPWLGFLICSSAVWLPLSRKVLTLCDTASLPRNFSCSPAVCFYSKMTSILPKKLLICSLGVFLWCMGVMAFKF